MRQIEIARRRRSDRRRVNLMIGDGLKAVDLETESRHWDAPLTEDHGRHRSNQDANFRVLAKALERGKLAFLGYCQRDARAVIRLRDPQIGFALRLAIGDDVEHDVT